ncbi:MULTISPECIES: DUF1697 domain-containing protein [Flavobacteriaceae]|uniref:DUF1697 domain-containing protein n=1 Tax=Flavobacteriaceae TaxID=49546 RepID=UPI001492A2AD|nr:MULTISPECIES: DUF1697 domain-containing protein [Allomuricauda]MDC6365518.1 DUF1697 domain-containing protein [Muricauda sp. AC10]
MKTFIALLRGINVSGQKKIKMADLKVSLEKIGLQNVTTYIQSGNVVFKSNVDKASALEELIHTCILKNFGFEVPILVITSDVVQKVLEANPFKDETEENCLYFVLLKQPPQQELVYKLNEQDFPNEDFHIVPNCVYLCCRKGYGNAKLNNNLIEHKLKVQATTRNLKTMKKLLDMASN